MKIVEIQDKHNDLKVWVIKITNCGHYYMNQKICGRLFYPKFERTTRRFLKQLLPQMF